MEKVNIATKYDITFVMSVTLNDEKYLNRFRFFLKNGLLNIGEKKVLLIAINGHGEIPEDIALASQNVSYDVLFLKNDLDCNSSKLANFLLSYEHINTDFICKMDEDSITNVDNLLQDINEYKNENLLYLTNHQVMKDNRISVRRILKRNDTPISYSYTHEWELCITNDFTIKRVLSNEDSVKYLEEVKDIHINVCGDHVWSVGYHLLDEETITTPVPSISCFFDIQNFNIAGQKENRYNHIHRAAPDYDYCKNIDTILSSVKSEKDILILLFGTDTNVTEDSLVWSEFSVVNNNESFTFEFLHNGDISTTTNRIPTYEIYQGFLFLYNIAGKVSYMFWGDIAKSKHLDGKRCFHRKMDSVLELQ